MRHGFLLIDKPEGPTSHDVVAIVPPDLVEVTVEKIAINAVMAGCRPGRSQRC